MADFNSYKRLIDSTTGGAGKNIPDNFLAGDSPKLKFNWTIKLNPADFSPKEVGSTDMDSNKFAVLTIDRSKPNIIYQDVNIYNFRTQVAVRTEYGTVNVTFYDDAQNNAHNILSAYLKRVSPIANASSGNGLDTYGTNASIGPLNRNLGPFESIVLTHYYYKGQSTAQTSYTYLNPKIVNFDFGDLSMKDSDVSMVTMTFNYDAVNINEG